MCNDLRIDLVDLFIYQMYVLYTLSYFSKYGDQWTKHQLKPCGSLIIE